MNFCRIHIVWKRNWKMGLNCLTLKGLQNRQLSFKILEIIDGIWWVLANSCLQIPAHIICHLIQNKLRILIFAVEENLNRFVYSSSETYILHCKIDKVGISSFMPFKSTFNRKITLLKHRFSWNLSVGNSNPEYSMWIHLAKHKYVKSQFGNWCSNSNFNNPIWLLADYKWRKPLW